MLIYATRYESKCMWKNKEWSWRGSMTRTTREVVTGYVFLTTSASQKTENTING